MPPDWSSAGRRQHRKPRWHTSNWPFLQPPPKNHPESWTPAFHRTSPCSLPGPHCSPCGRAHSSKTFPRKALWSTDIFPWEKVHASHNRKITAAHSPPHRKGASFHTKTPWESSRPPQAYPPPRKSPKPLYQEEAASFQTYQPHNKLIFPIKFPSFLSPCSFQNLWFFVQTQPIPALWFKDKALFLLCQEIKIRCQPSYYNFPSFQYIFILSSHSR